MSTNFLGVGWEVFSHTIPRPTIEQVDLSCKSCSSPVNPVETCKPVKKQTLIHILIYGLCGGILIVALRMIEFRFLIVEHSIEIYGGLIAALFAGFGIWLGLKLTRKKEVLIIKEVPGPGNSAFLSK